jgi:hypothetical protein
VWLKNQSKYSEPYNNPFWGKSNPGREEKERKIEKK